MLGTFLPRQREEEDRIGVGSRGVLAHALLVLQALAAGNEQNLFFRRNATRPENI